MEPELIVDYKNFVGEGPQWNPFDRHLYWLDIEQGRIYRYEPSTGSHGLFFETDVMIGGMTLQTDGTWVLFMSKGAIAVLRDGKLDHIFDGLPGQERNRFNDVIADSAGRVFCGTMGQASARAVTGELRGNFYRLDTDGSIHTVHEGTRIPNGMGFTADRKAMYYTESMDYRIYKYDYDEATGAISNRRTFVQVPSDGGLPDGMTVDSEGYVWSASAGGSALKRFTPDGAQERTIEFPAKMVSSVTFAGDGLDEMYVTTIGGNKKDDMGPGAGALFRLKLGIRGVPEYYSRIGLA